MTSQAQDSTAQTGCDCIELTNKALVEHNERLVTAYLFNRETGGRRTVVRISTDLIEKKRGQRPRFMIPQFCPFCGAKYPESEAPR